MLDCYSTNAVVAKIRSIYGTMFTRENYNEMIVKRNVSEVAEYLKRTARYSEILHGIDPNTVHRGFLELKLNEGEFSTYMRLCKFQMLDEKPFYNFCIKELICKQLINLINAVNNGLGNNFIEQFPGYMIKKSAKQLIGLSKCENYNELLNKLKGSYYYKTLKNVKLTDDGKADFMDAELKLMTLYYKDLLDNVSKHFRKSEAEELKKLVKCEIDIINISNAYRLKTYFGYAPEDIKKAMLPFTNIGKRTMDYLYESDTSEQMISRLEKIKYGKCISEGFTDIETCMDKYIYRYMKHVIAKTNYASVAIFTFVKLSEIELRNIVRIIEGVRYSSDSAVIEKTLVL